MAWTYTDDPANVPRDLVRSLIGDTVQKPTSPTDAIVDYWISQSPTDINKAASEVARHMARQYSSMDSTKGTLKMGRMSLPTPDYAAKSAEYWNLADELAGNSEVSGGQITPGYTPTVSQFSIGMMDG